MSVSSWIRRQFTNGVITTAQLSGDLASGTTTNFSVGSGQGSTFPDGSVGSFIITASQGKVNEEKILCSSRTGDTFSIASGGRGYNGTTAQDHPAGDFILHTIDAQDLDEANQVAHQTLGAIAASGDLLVGASTNTLSKLSRGAANTFLQTVGSSLQWTPFGSGGTTAVASSGSDGTSGDPARYDHTHAGVTSFNGSGGAVTGVASFNGGTGALSQTNGYGISGADADPPVPAVALTDAAGTLGSNYTVTGSMATFLTTSSLGIGTWLVAFSGAASIPAGADLDIQLAAGTATATFAGPVSTGVKAATDQVLALTTVVTVTGAGTLVFQAQGSESPSILTASPNSSVAGATGYTALRIK